MSNPKFDPDALAKDLHEAIVFYLENTEEEPRVLIDDLWALGQGGPVGAACAGAQQLHLYIKSLARDVEKAAAESAEAEAVT